MGRVGVLCDTATGELHTLRSRHLVGRSRTCDLRLADPRVSSEHAVLFWDDGRWWVRDLGARNGTWAGGIRLDNGGVVALERGAVLGFGGPSGWRLQAASAPVASACPVDGDVEVHESDGVLALPDTDEPEVVLYQRTDGAWVCERDEVVRVAEDLAQIEAGGRTWRVHLPEPHVQTVDVGEQPMRLDEAALVFRVSRNEEYVELDVTDGSRTVSIPTRAWLYTLLVLARVRRDDPAPPGPEHGWIDRDQLCRMLAVSKGRLAVEIHRARHAFVEAGVEGGLGVVERRNAELRLVCGDVRERPLGD